MFWGILIGIVLAALAVVLGMAFGKKDLTPLSYIVIVAALVAFCVEGVLFTGAIEAKKNIDNTVTAIQEAALTYIPGDAQNYRLGLNEAMGVKIGLRFLFPQVAQFIEPSDMVGRTLAESTEVLRQSVLRSANHAIWMNVIYMLITLVLATLLMVLAMGVGGGGGRARRGGGRGGRMQSHGRPQRMNARRGRR